MYLLTVDIVWDPPRRHAFRAWRSTRMIYDNNGVLFCWLGHRVPPRDENYGLCAHGACAWCWCIDCFLEYKTFAAGRLSIVPPSELGALSLAESNGLAIVDGT